MNAAQLKSCLKVLRWSTLTLADALHCDAGVVLPWYSGSEEVPEAVAEWLERLSQAHSAIPAPVGMGAPRTPGTVA